MDVCCLFRPFDEDRGQDRIRREAQAVSAIVSLCKKEGWEIIASEMIDFEMISATNVSKTKRVKAFFPFETERVMLSKVAESRAAFFQQNGIDTFDSYHLALAELCGADVFLTTDDRFLRKAKQIALKIKVENPETWLEGVAKNG
jgi:predicted nucleic acid-binding protein